MASSSSSASTSGSDTAEVGVKSDSSNAHDTCSWYSGVNCGKPRSCYDCLNVLLTSAECGIDDMGECVSVSSNSSSQSAGAWDILYTSSNATYCESGDSSCLACKSAWNAGYNESTTVCTGTDGCVCLEICESMVWEEEVLLIEGCMSGTGDSSYGDDGQDTGSGSKQMSTLTFVVFFFVLVFLLMIFRLVSVGARRISQRWHPEDTDNESDGEEGVTVVSIVTSSSRRPHARAAREPTNGPLLHLEGWRSYQEKLITAETMQLQGGMAPPNVPQPSIAQEAGVPRQEEHERTQAHV